MVAATEEEEEEEEERGPSYQMKESTREERRKEGRKNRKVSFPAEGRLPFSLSLLCFFGRLGDACDEERSMAVRVREKKLLCLPFAFLVHVMRSTLKRKLERRTAADFLV